MNPPQRHTNFFDQTDQTQLDDADLVGDVEGVVVRGQMHVGALRAVRTDESVHALALDLVQVLDGLLDLVLRRLQVALEDLGKMMLMMVEGLSQ